MKPSDGIAVFDEFADIQSENTRIEGFPPERTFSEAYFGARKPNRLVADGRLDELQFGRKVDVLPFDLRTAFRTVFG